MIKDMEPLTKKQIKEEMVYYTINWSRLSHVNKFDIINKVPAVAGIYELYYKDHYGKLNLFYMARVWYGGLRGALRESTDPLLVSDEPRKKVLEEKSCFYRYTMVSSTLDMEDILHYYACMRMPSDQIPGHSGRYREIYLEENSSDTIVTV